MYQSITGVCDLVCERDACGKWICRQSFWNLRLQSIGAVKPKVGRIVHNTFVQWNVVIFSELLEVCGAAVKRHIFVCVPCATITRVGPMVVR